MRTRNRFGLSISAGILSKHEVNKQGHNFLQFHTSENQAILAAARKSQ